MHTPVHIIRRRAHQRPNDELEEMTDDNCMAARAADEANNNMVVDDDSDDNIFDWEKIVHETETAEDDSSDFDIMEEDEEVPSDDDLSEYISDDNEDLSELYEIEMLPRGDRPDALQNNELSEDSKALLFWRHCEANGNNFSDWKIKVEAEKSDCDGYNEETVTVYNVHRFALAMGPKKSGYFEALLQSDCYSESSDRVSTVKLPEAVAKQFPDFLDYLYAQPQESNVVINFENWQSMKYLADYFLIPRLTEAVAEFIEKDMECFNPDHMEKYISVFHRDITDDMSRRILPGASRTCAKMFQSIDVDSPLLKSIPPAMLRSIIDRIDISPESDEQSLESQQNNALHTCSLIASYFDHVVEDIEVLGFFCSRFHLEVWLCHNDKSDDRIMDLALTWFRLMARKGWNNENIAYKQYNYLFRYDIEDLEFHLARITNDYLRSKTPSSEMMEKIVRDAPCHVVAKAVRESLDEARRSSESQDD